jgi:transposase
VRVLKHKSRCLKNNVTALEVIGCKLLVTSAIRVFVRIFSEEQAALLDIQAARFNVVTYSRLVDSQSRQIDILFKQVEGLQKHIFAQDQSLLITQEMIEQLRRAQFGRSSEKRPLPSPLFDQEQPAPSESKAESEKPKQKRKGHGRKPQPKLPVEEIHYTLTSEEVTAQGLRVFAGQYEVSEVINFYPPKVVLEKSLRQKYLGAESESGEPTIITAPGPLKLIEKSRYSVDFSIQAGLDKYESHLPLSRQVKRFNELGLEVTEQSLFDQIDLISWYFKVHVVQPIRSTILGSCVVQADETWWANLTDKKKFYLWAMTNEKAVSFVIYDSRSQESAENFLEGFKGTLLTDGYQCYKNIKTAEKLANDWAHVRRKFIQAEKTYPLESKWMVDQIRELSRIEQEVKLMGLGEILAAREARSTPIVNEIHDWLLDKKPMILPEGSLGKAIGYSLNLWQGLSVFLTNPQVPLTTNLIERLQRGPVVGRKNHYGSKTLRSAQVAADWYTVTGTCHLNEVTPRAYFKYGITEILAGRKPLLPWDFKNLIP